MKLLISMVMILFSVTCLAFDSNISQNFENSKENHFQETSECYDSNGEGQPLEFCTKTTDQASSLWINGILHGNVCRSGYYWCFMNGYYVIGTNCFCPFFYNGVVTTK